MRVQKLKSTGRLFFVSDVHGEIGVLLKGLDALGFQEGIDLCIHAGDLIDRGSDSLNTANHFLNDDTQSYFSVLGNHDVFAFENNTEETMGLWYINGGQWAVDATQGQRDAFGARMKKLPYVIQVEHQGKLFGVVHASVPQDFKDWNTFIENVEYASVKSPIFQEITWDREFVEYSNCNDFQIPLAGIDYTVHGHTPVREPLMVGNRLHIDTGLVYGKHLTIAEFVDGDFKFYKFDIMGDEKV